MPGVAPWETTRQGWAGPRASREGDQQCLIRDANEAIERLNVKLTTGATRLELRCECGDPACLERVGPTHAEYEAVRAYGSRFIVQVNHENPETASVISQNERFSQSSMWWRAKPATRLWHDTPAMHGSMPSPRTT